MNRVVIQVNIEVSFIKEVALARCEVRKAAGLRTRGFNKMVGQRIYKAPFATDLQHIVQHNALPGNTFDNSKFKLFAKLSFLQIFY